MQKPFLIFSGYNNRGVIAFCRFATSENIPFHVIACEQDDPILATTYAKNVIAVRRRNSLTESGLLSLLKDVKNTTNVSQYHCLPSSEYLNRFLLNNREIVERAGIEVPLCSKMIYEQISDKLRFSELCKEAGFDTPRNLTGNSCLEFPFVAKPKCYFDDSGKVQPKPVIIQTAEDFGAFSKAFNKDSFFFQEFVNGESHYLLLYVSKNGGDVAFSQRNLVQQPCGRSIIAAIPTTLYKESITLRYISFLKSLGFFGLIMIELRKCEDRFVMIEANPRIWGPMQLIVDCDSPILAAFAREHGHLQSRLVVREPKLNIKFFWSGGLASRQQSRSGLTFHGYSPEVFMNEYGDWLRHDVWLRPDSKDVFYREATQNEA